MPAQKTASPKRKTPTKPRAKPRAVGRKPAQGRLARTLPGAPTGKASAAPLATGDAPVRAYIATLPRQQRAIAQHFDSLIERTLPGVQRCIKWGMPFYGNDGGWFVSCGGFADHVKVTFLHGTNLKPVPPVGTGKYTRGVDLVTEGDMDDAQLASWLKQVAKFPGLGAGKATKKR